MSKVKIQGNASGSGVFTLTSPNSSTDRTITLPDGTGTLAFTTGDDDKLPLSGGTLTGALTITASTAKFKLEEIGGSYGELEAGGSGLHIKAKTGGYITLKPNDTEAIRILSNGKVGIGTTTAESKLTIDNDISTAYSVSGYAGTASNSMLYLNNTNAGSGKASLINFRVGTGDGLLGFVSGSTNVSDFVIATDGGSNGVERLRILNNGQVLIGGTTNTYAAKTLVTSADIAFAVTDGTKTLALWAQHGGSSNNSSAIGTRSNHDFSIMTNDVKRIRIGSSGGVVIDNGLQVATGTVISTGNSGGTVSLQAGGTYPGGKIRMRGGQSGGDFKVYTGGSTSSPAEALFIDSSGHVLMPLQPCFSILATPQANIVVSSWLKVDFDIEQFDTNSDFNTSSQTFTAPVAGKYLFQVRIRFDNVPNNIGYLHVGVNATNTQQQTTTQIGDFDYTGGITYYTEYSSFLFNMAANDTASIRVYQNGGTQQMDISGDSCFSGYLLPS